MSCDLVAGIAQVPVQYRYSTVEHVGITRNYTMHTYMHADIDTDLGLSRLYWVPIVLGELQQLL